MTLKLAHNPFKPIFELKQKLKGVKAKRKKMMETTQFYKYFHPHYFTHEKNAKLLFQVQAEVTTSKNLQGQVDEPRVERPPRAGLTQKCEENTRIQSLVQDYYNK